MGKLDKFVQRYQEEGRDIWLSPTGRVIRCSNLEIRSWKILKEEYGIANPSEDPDARRWLLHYGWVAYRDDECLGRGWMIAASRKPLTKFRKYGTLPTEAQKKKILELTGKTFEDSAIAWECKLY